MPIIESFDLRSLHCRFWQDGNVSRFACPLPTMPHLEMVRDVLEGKDFNDRYDKYITYAKSNYEQPVEERHSSERFRRNIHLWQRDFDDTNHPIVIATRNGITFITSGSHRASFAFAINRLTIAAIHANEDEVWGWPMDVARVASLQTILPESKWIERRTR
jgi:hypothetical protein